MQPTTDHFTIHGIPYCRTQLPLQNAFALTVHKTQGLTLCNIAISFDESMFSAGHAYTAISRALTWDQVQISTLSPDAFKADHRALEEYNRLESKHREIFGDV